MPTCVPIPVLNGLGKRYEDGFRLVRRLLPPSRLEAPPHTQPHAERRKRLFNKIFIRKIVGDAAIHETFGIDDGDYRKVVQHPKDTDFVAETLYAFSLKVLRNNDEVNILLNQEGNGLPYGRRLE